MKVDGDDRRGGVREKRPLSHTGEWDDESLFIVLSRRLREKEDGEWIR